MWLDDWYFKIYGPSQRIPFLRRIYWGVERYVEAHGHRFSIQDMAEVESPYRTGRGLRVRIGSRAFHLGRCKLQERPPGRELPDVTVADITSNYQGADDPWEAWL